MRGGRAGSARISATDKQVLVGAGETERPGEEHGSVFLFSGTPAARNAAAFGIVGRDGILNSMRMFI